MIQLYIDASTDVATGISGVGIIIKYQQKVTQYAIPLIHHYNNHEAEFIALIIALTIVQDHHQENLYIFSDSKTVVNALKQHHLNHPHLKELCYIARQRLQIFSSWDISWLSEQKNKAADHLARQACQKAKKGAFPPHPLNIDQF